MSAAPLLVVHLISSRSAQSPGPGTLTTGPFVNVLREGICHAVAPVPDRASAVIRATP